MSQQQLAARLVELGRPMQASGVAKVESGGRRVDVDDLAALAVALNVPIARLLLPEVEEFDEVRVVPGEGVPAWNAWQWANAEQSLWKASDDARDPGVQRRDLEFLAERPTWKRVHDQHPLSTAVRSLVAAADRTLNSVRGAYRGPGEPKASGAALRSRAMRVEQSLEQVRHALELLLEEEGSRG